MNKNLVNSLNPEHIEYYINEAKLWLQKSNEIEIEVLIPKQSKNIIEKNGNIVKYNFDCRSTVITKSTTTTI